MTRRTTLGLAALLALAGCSATVPGSAGPPEATSRPTSSGSFDVPPDGPGAAPEDGTSDAPPSPPTAEAAVATHRATVAGTSLALTMYPLVRSGSTVTMNVRLDVLAGVSASGVEVDRALTGTGLDDPLLGIPNGFQIVDEVDQLVHLPGRAGGKELCGPQFNGGWRDGDRIWVSCVFGAPPASVTRATVTAATFGSFAHVPIH